MHRSRAKSQELAVTDEDPGAAAQGAVARSSSAAPASRARRSGPTSTGCVHANPDATPAEIVTKLEKHYMAAVMASGAAVGSAAAFPGIGTLVAMSAVAGETVVFLEATAVYVLAVAEVHGIPAEHRERRRALVLAVLVGEDSKRAVADLLGPGRTSGAWLCDGAATLPLPVVSQLNNRLLRYFVKRYTLKRGAIAVRQDAAGRHRRGRRRRRQPDDGQEDHRERPQRRSARRRRGGPSPLHVLPAPRPSSALAAPPDGTSHAARRVRNDHKDVAWSRP